MTVKIKELVPNTIFSHESMQYELGSNVWHSDSCDKPYLGIQGAGLEIRSCYPRLGGQVQSKIEKWISSETQVSVS